MNRFNLSILILGILTGGVTLGLIRLVDGLPDGAVPKIVYVMIPLFGALAVVPFVVRLLNKQYAVKKEGQN